MVDAGTFGYGPALDLQNDLYRQRVAGEVGDVLLLLEHPHVYTLGRRFSEEHLLLSREALAQRGIEVFECDRGGSITYHGPGQLVGYPVLRLDDPDVITYLRTLEEVLIRAVASFGVNAGRREGLTGVWVGEEKLASIGVHVSRGVTKHGFALNVTTDLSFFGGMVPCGIPAVRVTSLERLLGTAPPMGEVRREVVVHLTGIFGLAGSTAVGLPGVTMREEARILPFPRNFSRKSGPPGGRVGSADG